MRRSGDGLIWQFPSDHHVGWRLRQRQEHARRALRHEAMLTPEGKAQNLKTSICAFEDDLTDFKDRSMAHVLRGNLARPRPTARSSSFRSASGGSTSGCPDPAVLRNGRTRCG